MSFDINKIKHAFFNNPEFISILDDDLQEQILIASLADDISVVEVIWANISEDLQRKYIAEVLSMNEYDDPFFASCIWCSTQNPVQEDNAEVFINLLKSSGIDYEYLEMLIGNTSENLLLNNIPSLIQIGRIYGLPATTAVAYKLLDNSSYDIDMTLTINDASELSVNQLYELCSVLKISGIKVGNNSYDIDTYKACRRRIDELLESVDFESNPNDPNREKYIFGQIARLIANNISYNFELVKKEKQYGFNTEDSITSRNLVGGLIDGSCVCVGYAETARNIFKCAGIDCIIICGDLNPKSGEDVHAWNQVKLDNEWFNADITFDSNRLVNFEAPLYLLKSDEDFQDHPTLYEKKDCYRTIPENELARYLYGTKFRITPYHIASMGLNFINQNSGILQPEISQVDNYLSRDKGDREVNE